MRLSLGWLREWVDWGERDQFLLDLLPLRGFEIESITSWRPAFEGVKTARIERIDTLSDKEVRVLTLVTGGTTVKQVVSSDQRLRAGDLVAYAAPGVRLSSGVVERRNVAGVTSEGFLCSWSELALGREHDRVLVIPDPLPPGRDLARFLTEEAGTIVEVAVTPNRGDCMSVYGLAREISALLHVPMRRPLPTVHPGPWRDDLRCDPPWVAPWFSLIPVAALSSRRLSLRRRWRLEQAGVASQHPLVDLTNYVLLELGQPLHAFDADRVDGEVCVRWAREGERLELLGGESLNLGPTHLVVADAHGPLSLAGVLGGRQSALTESTQRAWVEVAHFDPKALGRRPERLRIVTDASLRFERGVDPTLPPIAVTRLCELLREEAVGDPVSPFRRSVPRALEPRRISLPRGEVGRRLGCQEEDLAIASHLRALGLVIQESQDTYDVTIPPHRFDLVEPVDLVEEVARLYGFERLPSACPAGPLRFPLVHDQAPRHRFEADVRRFLVARGYDECRHLAFGESNLLHALEPEIAPPRLVNPLSREQEALVTTLWAPLLLTLGENIRRQVEAVRLFELATVFRSRDTSVPEERRHLAIVATGPVEPRRWGNTTRDYDIHDLRGDVDELFHTITGRRPRWTPGRHPALHPFVTARLVLDDAYGIAGRLHPALAKKLDLPNNVNLFYFDINDLKYKDKVEYNDPLRFPIVIRDLAFVVRDDIPVGEILGALEQVIGPGSQPPRTSGGVKGKMEEESIVRHIEIFDVYHGGALPAGYRSLALRLTFARRRGTLSDDEVSRALERVVSCIEGRFDGQIRG